MSELSNQVKKIEQDLEIKTSTLEYAFRDLKQAVAERDAARAERAAAERERDAFKVRLDEIAVKLNPGTQTLDERIDDILTTIDAGGPCSDARFLELLEIEEDHHATNRRSVDVLRLRDEAVAERDAALAEAASLRDGLAAEYKRVDGLRAQLDSVTLERDEARAIVAKVAPSAPHAGPLAAQRLYGGNLSPEVLSDLTVWCVDAIAELRAREGRGA